MPDGEEEVVEVPRGIIPRKFRILYTYMLTYRTKYDLLTSSLFIAAHIAVNLKDTKARAIVRQISCID
jgi:hypothetical protein